MATTTISNFRIVEQDYPAHPLSFDVYQTREEAEAYLQERADAIASLEISAVIVEDKIPARFIPVVHVPRRLEEVPAYLNFGSRIVARGQNWLVVGVPSEHANYLAGRLGSGLLGSGLPRTSLEDAVAEAQDIAARVYGAESV